MGSYNIGFNVSGPIVPGQPLAFEWQLEAWDEDTTKVGTVTAKVMINGNVLYTTPAPLQFVLRPGVVYWAGPGGAVVKLPALFSMVGENPTISPTSGAAANDLYKIGTNTLELVVIGSSSAASNPGPWKAQTTIVVNPESVDSSWWNWNPSPKTEQWGTQNPYSVGGSFTNKSQFANMSISWQILETEKNSSNSPVARGGGSVKISPSASASEQSTSITQNWEFIQLGTWIIDGPFLKSFGYNVNFTMVDDFNNTYANISSAELDILVVVAPWKDAAALTAMMTCIAAANTLAAAILAVAGVVTALAAPALFQTAGAEYAAALALGAIARDPPAPDPRYRAPVVVSYGKTVRSLTREKGMQSLASHAILIARMAKEIGVLDKIHGKILGARKANDRESLALQVASYLHYVELITSEASQLVSVSGKAQAELDKIADARKRKRVLLGIRKRGVSARVRKMALKNGLSKSALSEIVGAIRSNHAFTEKVSRPGSIMASTNSMLSLAREVRRNSLNVMKSAVGL